jgi:hypothetical protein
MRLSFGVWKYASSIYKTILNYVPQQNKNINHMLHYWNMNCERGAGPMLITVTDLARTLGANALMLVGDGEGFGVLERP